MGDDIRIGVSSEELVRALERAIAQWKNYIRVEDAAVTATINFNRVGEAQIRLTAAQADGQKRLNLVLQQTGQTYRTVNAQLTGNKAKLTEQAAVLNQLRDVQRRFNQEAQDVGTFVQRGVAFGDADLQAVVRYKNEVGKLKELVQGQVGGLKDVKRIWGQIEKGPGSIEANTRGARQLLQQISRVKTAEENLRQPLQDANQEVKTMNISWQSMIRLVGLQLARQAVSALTRAIAEGVRQAIELEKRIAEVRTISQEAQLPFEQWRDSLVELSNAFGIPVIDQVEAAYQTLSNQVAEGADTFLFLEEANKLALASVSSTSEAVNLLTASINAFELNVQDADQVAAGFFKTVELGRVRISEMATTIGDVGVLAHQLNIPLTDLQALIATLTINGIAYNKANTQLRGIFVKLLKPTKDMKLLFEEMGVASGEEAIRIFGLNGFLQKLIEVTQGSSTEIAKYISRIRGLSGILAIVNNESEKFVSNQEQIKNATASYVQAQALVLEASGKKLEIELNKIKNFFLVELGDTLLQVVAESTNGFEGLTAVVKGFADTILIVLVPALTVLTAKLLVLAYSNPFSAAITSALLLIQLMRTIARRAEETAELERRAFEASWQARVEAAEKASDQITTDFKEALDAQILAVERFAANTFGAFAQLRKDTIKDTKDFGKDLTAINRSVTKDLTAGINAAKKEFQQFSKLAEQLREETTDTFREAGRFLFEVQIEDQGFEGKIQEIQNRIIQLREASVFALAFEDKDAFDEIRREILGLAKQDREIRREAQEENRDNTAERIKLAQSVSKENEKFARRRLDLHLRLQDQLNNERKNHDSIHKIRVQLNRLVEDHEKKIKAIEDAEKKLLDNNVREIDFQKEYLELISEEAQQRTAWAERAEKQAEEAHQREIDFVLQKIELEAAFREFQQFNLKEILKLTDAAAARDALEERRSTTRELFNILEEVGVSEEAQARLRERNLNEERVLRERIFELERRNALEQLKLQSETIATRFKATQEAIKAERVELIDLDKRFEFIRKTIAAGIAGDRTLFEGPPVALGAPGTFEASQRNRLRTTLEPIQQILKDFAEFPSVGGVDVVVEQLGKLRAAVRNVPIGDYSRLSQQAHIETERLRGAINGLINDYLDTKEANETLEDKMRRLGRQEEALRAITKSIQAEQADTNKVTEQAVTQTATFDAQVKGLNTSLKELQENLEKVKQSLRTMDFPVPVGAEFTGEPFAKGGQPHGHDIVPAMLSPGEFVVNAAATRKFYSQLVRMNSGVQHFDRGGQVSNVNVGDINVNLPNATSPDYDAVRLGKVLRRGIRRGTIKL